MLQGILDEPKPSFPCDPMSILLMSEWGPRSSCVSTGLTTCSVAVVAAWECGASLPLQHSQVQGFLSPQHALEGNMQQPSLSWGESQNHGIVWVGRTLKPICFSITWKGHFPLPQVIPSPYIWPGLGHYQGWDSHDLTEQTCASVSPLPL